MTYGARNWSTPAWGAPGLAAFARPGSFRRHALTMGTMQTANKPKLQCLDRGR